MLSSLLDATYSEDGYLEKSDAGVPVTLSEDVTHEAHTDEEWEKLESGGTLSDPGNYFLEARL